MPAIKADYIIIGAGSAGCVLANELSSDPSCEVLLLEAGPMDRNLFIHIPAGVYRVFRDPNINWNYSTADEEWLSARSIFTPRGRVIGGSSSINSMVYMRGHPLDFDGWAEELGLKEWSFANCLPYFKAGENYAGGADDYRGSEGRLNVETGHYPNPLYDAFLEAGEKAGQGRSNDLNGYRPEGVARLDATKFHGRRCSAATAHLKPAIKRQNLTVITGAETSELMLHRNRVIGVSFYWRGELHDARAESEIILSSGAINSPKLMMLSGIGPKKHLERCNIQVRAHLPGVGQNLQDHAKIRLQFSCLKRLNFHRLNNPLVKVLAGIAWGACRRGIGTSNIWEAGGLVRSNDRVAYPNLQYHFGPLGFTVENQKIKVEQAFSLNVDQMRPISRGDVNLDESNPAGSPVIKFNYMQHPGDLKEMVEGVKLARELVAQAPFDEFRGIELKPGASITSDQDLEIMLRQNIETAYHPSCTCRMGHDFCSVVDSEFKVHEIEGLRIVDASAMPRIITGNLNAPIQMMAFRAADYILRRPQKKPVHLNFNFDA
jgi:choline dehydrogenase